MRVNPKIKSHMLRKTGVDQWPMVIRKHLLVKKCFRWKKRWTDDKLLIWKREKANNRGFLLLYLSLISYQWSLVGCRNEQEVSNAACESHSETLLEKIKNETKSKISGEIERRWKEQANKKKQGNCKWSWSKKDRKHFCLTSCSIPKECSLSSSNQTRNFAVLQATIRLFLVLFFCSSGFTVGL